jgi:hypothetical protein
VNKIKPPRFDGSMSWTQFHGEVKARVKRNSWTNQEKARHLLALLQGQAVYILHSVPSGPRYKDMAEVLEGHYGDNQPAMVYQPS